MVILELLASWMSGPPLSMLLLYHPLGWLLFLAGVACAALAVRRTYVYRPSWWVMLLWPLLTTFSVSVLGVVFSDKRGPTPAEADAALLAVNVVNLANLLVSPAIVALARGFRLPAAAVMCAGTFVLQGSVLQSVMMITGDWL